MLALHNPFIQKGLVPSTCIAFPFVDLENSNEPTYLWVDNCSFCGLGFKLSWVGQITSYKHGWCAFVHFNKSTKCIDPLCQEKMHKC